MKFKISENCNLKNFIEELLLSAIFGYCNKFFFFCFPKVFFLKKFFNESFFTYFQEFQEKITIALDILFTDIWF